MPDSFEQLFELYRETFPVNERRTESDLRAALNTSAYKVIARHDGTRLIGFAILFIPPAEGFALLEYLAVEPASRNRGVGRDLVRSTINQADDWPLLTEIESESSGALAIRRQQFYSRCGFRRIPGLKYQLPLPGDPPPMELWLNPPSMIPVNRSTIAHWLTTIYAEVYHRPPNDQRIQQMLDSLE